MNPRDLELVVSGRGSNLVLKPQTTTTQASHSDINLGLSFWTVLELQQFPTSQLAPKTVYDRHYGRRIDRTDEQGPCFPWHGAAACAREA